MGGGRLAVAAGLVPSETLRLRATGVRNGAIVAWLAAPRSNPVQLAACSLPVLWVTAAYNASRAMLQAQPQLCHICLARTAEPAEKLALPDRTDR